MLERVLGIILPVFSIIALGWLYARRAKPDMGWVNRINMNVLAPALIFSALASKDFDLVANRLLILGSIGIVLGSGLLAWPFATLLHEDHRTFVPPMMFNNCGNMGLPLAVLAFGQAGFSAMVALFTISNLLHFTLGAWIIDHHARFGRLLQNPMVVVDVRRLRLRARRIRRCRSGRRRTFKIVGDALIPMMLLSLGVRLIGRALERLAPRRRRRPRLPADRHRDGGAAEPRPRARRRAAGPAHPVRLPAAGGAQLHGRRAVPAGARQGRVDRADRQHDVGRCSCRSGSRWRCADDGATIAP